MRTGYCECGCGQETKIATRSSSRYGHVKGEPIRFIKGHAGRGQHSHSHVVDEVSGCWIWQGNTNNGKGYFRVSHRGERIYVHRWYYERFVGPIPEGLQLDHLCRNRNCCNPEHLEPVTQAENLRRGIEARKKAAA